MSVAYAFGAGIGACFLFFPMTYFGIRNYLKKRPSIPKLIVLYLVSSLLTGIILDSVARAHVATPGILTTVFTPIMVSVLVIFVADRIT